MTPLRAIRFLGGAVLLGALYGLFSAPVAQAADDARRATPPPGKALVFVFRSERDVVSATVPVSVNGERIGDLANGTFASATVNPGTTFLRAGDRVLTTLALEAEANKSYFVWVEAVPGVSPVRSEMRLVSESSGRRSLEQSRFVGVAPAAVVAAPRVVEPSQTAQPAAKPAAEPVASKDWDAGEHAAIILKAGTFKLAESEQDIGGSLITFDDSSKSVFGIEAEWRGKDGLAWGGEIFYYENEFSELGTPYSGKQSVAVFTGNAKFYFPAASWLYPFVGGGIGVATASYSGDASGGASGFAYQAMAGVEFRFRPVGLYLMGKYLGSTVEDSEGVEIKVGGTGFLAGVSFMF